MANLSVAKLYEIHVSNLAEVGAAMDRTAQVVREAIRRSEDFKTLSFTKLFALLLGVWAECRLQKLLHEAKGFTTKERQAVSKKKSQFERWKEAIKIAFRRHYGIRKASLSSLDYSARTRLEFLLKMLEEDLRPVIDVRNKLAHGQWAYPLTNDGYRIAAVQARALRTENLLSLQFKKQLIVLLTHTVHDLVVSKSTFERDFDAHERHIRQAQTNLKKRTFATYQASIRGKHERGKLMRKSDRTSP